MENLMDPNSDYDGLKQSGEAESPAPARDPEEDFLEALPEGEPAPKRHWQSWKEPHRLWAVLILVIYLLGLGSGYALWGWKVSGSASNPKKLGQSDIDTIAAQMNPKGGYELPASYGDIGPKLIESGAISLNKFVKIYLEMGKPLTDEQMAILTEGSSASIVINQDNQHFLLNLFWAFGLANQNQILTEGPMVTNGQEKVVNFASTGGWSLASRPIIEIYASNPIINLTEDQQKRLEEVALGVYRPCCNNPTHFPDCNHGMAMLGLLELMASQGASVNEMFRAAKYINAYWFPQQTLEVAIANKSLNNVGFEQSDSRQVVGRRMMSGSGYQAVHQWLVQGGKLEELPQGGGSCGVQ